MPRTRAVAVLIGLALLCGNASADGIQMFELCKRPHRDMVIAYVTGALERANMDVNTVVADLEGALIRDEPEKHGLKKAWKSLQSYCSPGGDEAFQAANSFCDFLLMNPSERRKPSIETFDKSLQKAWPCPPLHSAAR